RGPDDLEGQVLRHVPMPDLLAPGHARRVARAVVDRTHRPIRAGQDQPRRSSELAALVLCALGPIAHYLPEIWELNQLLGPVVPGFCAAASPPERRSRLKFGGRG